MSDVHYCLVYDYNSEDGSVHASANERVTVLQRQASGWWEVRRSDNSFAWIPASYLTPVRRSAPRDSLSCIEP